MSVVNDDAPPLMPSLNLQKTADDAKAKAEVQNLLRGNKKIMSKKIQAVTKLQAIVRGRNDRLLAESRHIAKSQFRMFDTYPGLVETFEQAELRFANTSRKPMRMELRHNSIFFKPLPAKFTFRSVVSLVMGNSGTADVFPVRDSVVFIDEFEETEGDGDKGAGSDAGSDAGSVFSFKGAIGGGGSVSTIKKHQSVSSVPSSQGSSPKGVTASMLVDMTPGTRARHLAQRRRRSTYLSKPKDKPPPLNYRTSCKKCQHTFGVDGTVLVHCRHCGDCYCEMCVSDQQVAIPKFGLCKPVVVCEDCFDAVSHSEKMGRQAARLPHIRWQKTPSPQREMPRLATFVEEQAHNVAAITAQQSEALWMFLVKTRYRDVWVSAPSAKDRAEMVAAIEAQVEDLQKQEKLAEAERAQAKDSKRVFAQWELKFCDVTLNDRVGSGAFGEVFRGTLWGKDVAIKTLKRNKDQDMAVLEADLKQETAILCQLRHPHLVLFMGACAEIENMCIVTEWCGLGSLNDLMFKPSDGSVHFPIHFIAQCALDIAQGLNYLHQLATPIIHRDLKSHNVLVAKDYTMKIADFGLSFTSKRLVGDKDNKARHGIMGTPEWMAPEVLGGGKYNEKVDVWSFGMVMCELLTHSVPFRDQFRIDDWNDVRIQVCHHHAKPTVPSWTPSALQRLITVCVRSDPDFRPSFAQIIMDLTEFLQQDSHEMFAQHDLTRLRALIQDKRLSRQSAACNELADAFRSHSTCRRCDHHGHKVELPTEDFQWFLQRLIAIITLEPPKHRELPKGWREAISDDGRKFYYNRKKQRTQWRKPRNHDYERKLAQHNKRELDACRAMAELLVSCDKDQLRLLRCVMQEHGMFPVLLQALARDPDLPNSAIITDLQEQVRRVLSSLIVDIYKAEAQEEGDNLEKPQGELAFVGMKDRDLERLENVIINDREMVAEDIRVKQQIIQDQNKLLDALRQYREDAAQKPDLPALLLRRHSSRRESRQRAAMSENSDARGGHHNLAGL